MDYRHAAPKRWVNIAYLRFVSRLEDQHICKAQRSMMTATFSNVPFRRTRYCSQNFSINLQTVIKLEGKRYNNGSYNDPPSIEAT